MSLCSHCQLTLRANTTPLFKMYKNEDPETYRPVSLISISGKVTEHLILENTSRDVKNKKVIRSSQHCFTKGKSCLTNLVNFYDEMSGLVLCQVLYSSEGERHAHAGQSSANIHKEDEGTGTPLL